MGREIKWSEENRENGGGGGRQGKVEVRQLGYEPKTGGGGCR